MHTRGAHAEHTNVREMSGVPPPPLASSKANATVVEIVCARAAVVGHFSLPALETFPLPAHDAWCSEQSAPGVTASVQIVAMP